jgi:uncharacterized protein (UPF0332 family)
MHWNEFLDTADRLSRGATEGDWRSALSRAYYAVFHYFREFLLAQGLDVGRAAPSHFNLYSGLLHCGFVTVARIASRLDDLRAERGAADYDLRRPVHQALATKGVQDARDLITDFQNLLTSVSPVQIADGARRHLQATGRIRPAPPP